MRRHKIFSIALCALTLLVSVPAWATDYTESPPTVELSNSGSTPTPLTLTAGSNIVTAAMPGSDLDFLRVTIPVGHVFSSLTLVSYFNVPAGGDGIAFIGMKNGNTIAVTSNPANLNGYTHFGSGVGNIGQDILDDIGQGEDSVGFTPPLAAGNYSFWIQQAGTANTNYKFNFGVTALPPPSVDGDYNGDEVVDSLDYVFWRQSFGAEGADLPADGNDDDIVNDLDFDYWAERFGNPPGSGTNTAVPEPATVFLLGSVALVFLAFGRGRLRRLEVAAR